MSARFEFTKQIKRHAMAMRRKGFSVKKISQAIGCSTTTLRKQRLNLGSLQRRFTKKELQRMVAMRKQGFTIQQIAKAVDASPSGISRHVSRLVWRPALTSRPFERASAVPAATRQRVVVLRRSGYTYWKIANMVGHAYATVRAIVLTNGRPPERKSPLKGRKVYDEEIARIIALRRGGSSYTHIAQEVGISSGAVGKILRNNGFSGRIRLLRLGGPVGSRVRGICVVPRCGVRHYGSGLCSKHERMYQNERIDKSGKRLPSFCEECGKRLTPSYHRRWCVPCKRARDRAVEKRKKDYVLGYADKSGRPLPLTCAECGRKFARGKRIARFCPRCRETRAKRQILEWNQKMRRRTK